MTDWQRRAQALAADLAGRGLLPDPRWRAAFEAVPRHLFVPSFHTDSDSVLDGADPRSRDEWLDAVYADETLVIQLARVPGTDLRWSTSSSTQPSMMARMLHLLEVGDHGTVAEIGTGTGYTAALLCHRVGDTRVASIDIDPDLVAAARGRLAQLGYRPQLAVGDGARGIPDGSPFDRIIATAAVPAIPPAWITQLNPGGLIVTDLRGEIASSLLVLRKLTGGSVEGRFLGTPGYFMWLRRRVGNPLRDGGAFALVCDRDGAEQRPTAVDPALVEHPDLRLVLQLLDPSLRSIWRSTERDTELLCLSADDDSWAEVDTAARGDRYTVTQGGPRRIWDGVERAAQWWQRHGRPGRDRFGITAHADGSGQSWLDTPDQPWAEITG